MTPDQLMNLLHFEFGLGRESQAVGGLVHHPLQLLAMYGAGIPAAYQGPWQLVSDAGGHVWTCFLVAIAQLPAPTPAQLPDPGPWCAALPLWCNPLLTHGHSSAVAGYRCASSRWGHVSQPRLPGGHPWLPMHACSRAWAWRCPMLCRPHASATSCAPSRPSVAPEAKRSRTGLRLTSLHASPPSQHWAHVMGLHRRALHGLELLHGGTQVGHRHDIKGARRRAMQKQRMEPHA